MAGSFTQSSLVSRALLSDIIVDWLLCHSITLWLRLVTRWKDGCLLLSLILRAWCSSRSRWENDSNDESVKCESLRENHHKDNSDHDISLGISTDTSISNDSNTESRGEAGKSTAKSSGELFVTIVVVSFPSSWIFESFVGVWNLLDIEGEEDSNNESIDTQDTRHDNWNDGLEDKVWLQDGDGADTDSWFGGSVGGSHVGEHKTSDHTHGGEEHGLVWITEVSNGIHWISAECSSHLLSL